MKSVVPYNTHGTKPVTNPITLGDKLRNRRLELGLSQSQVAGIFNTSSDLIYMWENNIVKPAVKRFPKVIKFLDYFPFEIDQNTFGGKIKLYRYTHGLSQEGMAKFLNLNECTVRDFERNIHKPYKKVKAEIINKLSN